MDADDAASSPARQNSIALTGAPHPAVGTPRLAAADSPPPRSPPKPSQRDAAVFRTQSSLENGVKEMNLRYKEFGDVKVSPPPPTTTASP